ncbi:hypothetical protein FACS189476_03740 [Spirochaetia bacterium]|nr:hypothetical protein FACS189476_03740 [Spirochaetia bacterium]
MDIQKSWHSKPIRILRNIVLPFVVIVAAAAMTHASARVSTAAVEPSAYKSLTLSEVSKFDSNIWRKQFVPLPKKRGILLNLQDTHTQPVIELVLSAGKWNTQFLPGGVSTNFEVLTGNNERFLLYVPPEALGGYDRLIFTPVSGRNVYIAYCRPIESADFTVLNNITPVVNPYVNSTQHDITGVIGYFADNDGENMRLQAQSISEIDIVLLSVVTGNGKTIAKFADNTILETIKTSKMYLQDVSAALVKPAGKYKLSDIYLEYRYADDTKVKQSKINPFRPYEDEIWNSTQVRTTDNLSEFDFIRQNDNIVTFEGENIKLDRSIFVPQGKKFVLNVGQTVDLSNGAVIFCRDAIEVNGTAENPVRLISTDGTGDGLVVLQANSSLGRSTVNYLTCDNLDFIENGIYYLTGCVTFYESDVDFYGCQFLNNKSEDGLNVIRSDMTAKYCTFYNAYQDAFDSDFCTGLFENCHFELSGNDAFDMSTSTYIVRNCTFKNIHDKCLSIGENSTATIEGITADTAQAIIGAKDTSTVRARNLTGKDIFIGYLAYQKKPEFGHSTAYIENMKLTGIRDFDYLIQGGETYYLDGVQKLPKGKKKEALIIKKIINEEPILR